MDIDTVKDIDTSSKEGKMLLAALAILTTISEENIRDGIYGASVYPDKALEKIVDLSNYMFDDSQGREMYERSKVIKSRNLKIGSILNGE